MEPPRLLSNPPPPERPGRVVIVEPALERRRQLRKLLAQDAYECILLPDGDELLRVCAEFEPDLLLLAVDLAGSSGLELCGDVRALETQRHIPVMLLAESADESTVAAGLLAGADDFISDLSREQELQARIHVQLRSKRLFDTLQRVRSERDLLRRDSQIDSLTGLLNRRSLELSITERCSSEERFGLLFIDIDHFKLVNDRYGHDIGDRVLTSVAAVLRAGLRPGDMLARWGGEEFLALISGAGPESARLVAERLRRHVEEMPQVSRGPGQVSVSIGTTVFDPQRVEEEAPELLRRADMALYEAKRSGRNRVVLLAADAPFPGAPDEGVAGMTPTLGAARGVAEARPPASQFLRSR